MMHSQAKAVYSRFETWREIGKPLNGSLKTPIKLNSFCQKKQANHLSNHVFQFPLIYGVANFFAHIHIRFGDHCHPEEAQI